MDRPSECPLPRQNGELSIPSRINQEAAQWFAQREAGGMTAEDEARLAQWLARDLRHRRAFDRAEAMWQALEAPMLAPSSGPARRRWRWGRPGRPRPGRKAGAAIAAGLALLLVVQTDLPTRLRADAMTATGERRDVRLPDGSIATLNTASAIAFSDDGRKVRLLAGEAAFQVAPNAGQPFQVEAGDGASTALGTRFIVRRIDGGARVTVTEHSVRVALDRQAIVLREGEAVAYERGAIGRPHRVAISEADAWTRGRMRVVNRPLGEIVAELDRYHPGYIRVIGADVARRPVSGTFDVRDPVGALDVIQRTLGIGSTRITDRLIFLHS